MRKSQGQSSTCFAASGQYIAQGQINAQEYPARGRLRRLAVYLSGLKTPQGIKN
jgi:hypothetical protein